MRGALIEQAKIQPVECRVTRSNPVAHPSFLLRLVNRCPAASSSARADSAKRGRPISFVTAARAALSCARFDFLDFTDLYWHSATTETVSFSTPAQQIRQRRTERRIS